MDTRQRPSQPPSSRLQEILSVSELANRFEELSDTDNEYEDMGTVTGPEAANITYINKMTQPIRDSLKTETSITQDQTLEALLPFLEGNENGFPLNSYGLPKLQRERHVAFLTECVGNYPEQYVALDAARPWFVYWSMQGLTALGQDISQFQDRYVQSMTMEYRSLRVVLSCTSI